MKRILANVLENNYENPDFENDIKRTVCNNDMHNKT